MTYVGNGHTATATTVIRQRHDNGRHVQRHTACNGTYNDNGVRHTRAHSVMRINGNGMQTTSTATHHQTHTTCTKRHQRHSKCQDGRTAYGDKCRTTTVTVMSRSTTARRQRSPMSNRRQQRTVNDITVSTVRTARSDKYDKCVRSVRSDDGRTDGRYDTVTTVSDNGNKRTVSRWIWYNGTVQRSDGRTTVRTTDGKTPMRDVGRNG